MEISKAQYLQLDQEVRDDLESLLPRIAGQIPAKRLWKLGLSAAERRDLEGQDEICRSAVAMWMKIHKVSRPRAIIDVSNAIGVGDKETLGWLSSQLGELEASCRGNATDETKEPLSEPKLIAAGPVRPEWFAETGELRFKGKLAKKLQLRSKPSHSQLIVEAFARDNWPRSIKNPWPEKDPQFLHDNVATLRNGLSLVDFHVQRGAKEIRWEEETPSELPV